MEQSQAQEFDFLRSLAGIGQENGWTVLSDGKEIYVSKGTTRFGQIKFENGTYTLELLDKKSEKYWTPFITFKENSEANLVTRKNLQQIYNLKDFLDDCVSALKGAEKVAVESKK